MSGVDLAGKSALITGAASGIGRAIAIAFAEAGAKLVIGDKNLSGLEETYDLIAAAGAEAEVIELDVAAPRSVAAAVALAVARYGRLDCAANNAGVPPPRVLMHELQEKDWDRIININLKGVWLCLKYEIIEMLKQGGGSIVNIASLNGILSTGHATAYTASKHGVVGLTREAAVEYAKHGIRVNAICPGYTRTPMMEGAIAELGIAASTVAALHPMNRLADPREMAAAALWLCSDASSFVTGVPLPVDGGYSSV
jgi:NAD(P)-dependent dehydrogenase (short-subunit alcohol dehydrogenase family)